MRTSWRPARQSKSKPSKPKTEQPKTESAARDFPVNDPGLRGWRRWELTQSLWRRTVEGGGLWDEELGGPITRAFPPLPRRGEQLDAVAFALSQPDAEALLGAEPLMALRLLHLERVGIRELAKKMHTDMHNVRRLIAIGKRRAEEAAQKSEDRRREFRWTLMRERFERKYGKDEES